MPEPPSPPRRFRASIGEVMGLVAPACAWPGLIPTQVIAVLIWVAARRGSEQAKVRLVSMGMLLVSLYLLPVVNFFLLPGLDPAWSRLGPDWRRDWSPIFPTIPGILPILMAGNATGIGAALSRIRPDTHEVVFVVPASLATAAVVYTLTLLAGRSRVRRAFAAMFGFLWSAFSTFAMTVVVIARGV